MQEKFKEVFFENLEKRIGFSVKDALEEKGHLDRLSNNIETIKKVNTNTTRGGEKGRKGFNYEYLVENELRNQYIKNGNKERAKKVKVLDNNDEIIDIKDNKTKLQLKNVKDPANVDFEKYVNGGAYIVVPNDYYDNYENYLNKKISSAKTIQEEEFYKKAKKKLKKSNLSSKDADNPNLYMTKQTIKDSAEIVGRQYTDKMKKIIVAQMLQIFLKKIKEVYNDDSKNFIDAIKEIISETTSFIKEVWHKELGNTLKDIVIGLIKQKILSFFTSVKKIIEIFLDNLKDLWNLLKQFFKGEISLKEFIRLTIKTFVLSLLTIGGIVLEKAIATSIGIPVVGDFIAMILSIGIISFGTVIYSEYIETAIFGLTKIFKSSEVLLEQKKAEEIKTLVEQRLPEILANREQVKIEFQERLNKMKTKADNSFAKLKDDSLSVEEFEKEFQKIGDILGIKI